MELVLSADDFRGSPLFEGNLASIIFTGTGEFSLVTVYRIINDPDGDVEIQIGSQELSATMKAMRLELGNSYLRISFDATSARKLHGYSAVVVKFMLSEAERRNLIESIESIISDDRGELVLQD